MYSIVVQYYVFFGSNMKFNAFLIPGCNEITEQGLWSSLHPRLVSVTINDCINVADECICAVTQLLPALYEFNLQVKILFRVKIYFCFV